MIPVSERIQIPETELEWSYARSGGPGGQNVNKVSSKAVLRWPVTTSPSLPDEVRARFLKRYVHRVTVEGDLVLSSERYRDQPRNRQDCLDKLVSMLQVVLKPPTVRKVTKPSKGSKIRRLQGKKHQSATKAGRRTPGGDD